MLSKKKVILFIGVCGNGMAPLAIYSSQIGHKAYGYDDFQNKNIKDLLIAQKVAMLPFQELPSDCNLVVYSSAINTKTNQLIQQAHAKNIQCVRRGEFLNEITKSKKLIAIIGSHGKTSVCAAFSEIIQQANLKSDYVLGGFFKNNKYLPIQHLIDSEYVVAEIDESDCTINNFSPDTTIVLNFDDDHSENYNGLSGLLTAFQNIIKRTKNKIFINQSCDLFDSMLNNISSKVIKLPLGNNVEIAKFVANEIFNYDLNNQIKFVGAKYRHDVLCEIKNATVIQDYAHHPTEVRNLLNLLRKKYQQQDLHVIFQPHRFSRTEKFQQAFANILTNFDNISVLPIHSAFEKNPHNISSNNIFEKIPNKNKQLLQLEYLKETAIQKFNYLQNKNTKSVMIFIGAGTITKFSEDIAQEIKIQSVRDLLDNSQIEMQEHVKTKTLTTLHIENELRLLISPSNVEQLQKIIKLCSHVDVNPIILGRGSNLLLPTYSNNIFISLNNKNFSTIEWLSETAIRCGAFVKLQKIGTEVYKKDFCDFENLAGIPGTLGGAVVMNAGAHQHSISEFIETVEIVDDHGNYKNLKKADIEFLYRKTIGLENCIITHVVLEFKNKSSQQEIQKHFNELRDWRKQKQPQESSVGSVFKNPTEQSAGYLIEQTGLKGFHINNISISEKHANFFINKGNGLPADFEQLIDIARYKVYEKFDIFLENEVKIIREI